MSDTSAIGPPTPEPPTASTIRSSTSADWEHYRDIRLQALRSAPTAFGSTYAGEQDRTEEIWRERAGNPRALLAFADGRPVGIAVGYDDPDEPAGTRSLVSMFVVDEQRGTGLATRLIDAVVVAARADGARQLALWVTEGNIPASLRYRAYGFRETGERAPLPHDSSLTELRMVLDLADLPTLTVGIDIGGTTIKAALVDSAHPHRVLARAVAASPPAGSEAGATVLAACGALFDDLRAQAGELGLPDPVAVGVAVPGIIDEPNGIAVYSSAFDWADEPVRDELAARVGVPVAFGHDVRSAGLAEWRLGAGRGCDNLLVLALGTGIGSAVVVDGRLVTAGGYAGQLGHVVIEADGPLCGCGQRGCAGMLASARAIHHAYAKAAERRVDEVGGAREVAELVAAGDPVAIGVWSAAIGHLARLLVAAVTMLGPRRVVIAGGPSDAGELLIGPVREQLRGALTFQRMPDVLAAELGSDAGVLGGAIAGAELAGRRLPRGA